MTHPQFISYDTYTYTDDELHEAMREARLTIEDGAQQVHYNDGAVSGWFHDIAGNEFKITVFIADDTVFFHFVDDQKIMTRYDAAGHLQAKFLCHYRGRKDNGQFPF